LLHLLDEAFDHRAWHGTNLRGAVRGLDAATAAWRPHAARHNVWEIVVHAAYWKYAVRRRLTREKRGSFALQGSNWFKRPQDRSDAAWSADVRLLVREHEQLCRVVEGLSDAEIDRRSGGSRWTKAALIRGVASHDLYHAGQIQLLKRLRVVRSRSR
jgi:DNA-binding CsgD family transcriptional regulator